MLLLALKHNDITEFVKGTGRQPIGTLAPSSSITRGKDQGSASRADLSPARRLLLEALACHQ